jgi:hypothetical protein
LFKIFLFFLGLNDSAINLFKRIILYKKGDLEPRNNSSFTNIFLKYFHRPSNQSQHDTLIFEETI